LPGDGAKKFVCGGEWRAVQAFGTGEIEISFVDGDHFDDRREFRQDRGNAIAPFGVFFVVAVEKDGVGAKASGGAEGHGGVDAEFAGFVAGGGNDSTLVRAATNHNGLAAEVGAVE
jgi:hypothetical protein